MLDPEFSPGSEHVAHAQVTNSTPKAWTYNSELYLVKAGTKYASSGIITFTLAAGAAQTINFPIIMPDIEGTYKVYLDVYVAGELIGAYQAIEDVTIVSAVPVFSYSNMNLQIPYIPVPGAEEGFYYIDIQCDITNIGGAGTLEVSAWLSNHNMYVDPSSPSGYTFEKITIPSFAGWASWAIPLGGLDWDPGTMQLTLGPGGTYHFHYAGAVAAWNAYNWVQLRDNSGGESVIIKKFSGSRTD